jgi:two-component system, cell cycle sensor histidine kinase and response regulator CckA
MDEMGSARKNRDKKRQILRELKDDHEFLLAVIDRIGDGIFVKDKDHRLVVLNEIMCGMFGQKREVLIGKSDYDFLPRGEADVFWEKDNEVIRTGRENVNEETITDSHQVTRTLVTKKNLYSDPLGREFVVAVARDVTKQKQTEQALRESEELMRLVIDTTPAHIFVKNRKGEFLLVNKMASESHGVTPQEMLGKNELQLAGDSKDKLEQIRKFLADDQEIIDSQKPKFIPEEPLLLPDGTTQWLQTTKIPLTLKGKSDYVLGVAIDITGRKNAEDELKKKNEMLVQSQKMEAVGRLAGGIAHDFNNLLTAIIGYGELLKLNGSVDTDSLQCIEEVLKSAKRAASLTQQLLAFSRKQVLQPKIVDLNKLINETQVMLRRLIGEDIELIVKQEPDLGKVKADPGQIEQVIMNLVVNARDAMPTGGKLTIETRNVCLGCDVREAHFSVKEGYYVRLSVNDSGIGMTEETKKHLFEPFFTTKERGKGTGLGLSTVYGIIQQSSGNILVTSAVGKGAAFDIYLPMVRDIEEDEREARVKAAARGGNETVLIVEDEDVVRNMLSRALNGYGYTVLEARNGREALSLLSDRRSGRIDLLVTDVVMPEMSGEALARKIVEKDPGVKVLYISGYTNDAVVHHGVLDKGVQFLQKPFTPQSLARKVLDILNAEGNSGPHR